MDAPSYVLDQPFEFYPIIFIMNFTLVKRKAMTICMYCIDSLQANNNFYTLLQKASDLSFYNSYIVLYYLTFNWWSKLGLIVHPIISSGNLATTFLGNLLWIFLLYWEMTSIGTS